MILINSMQFSLCPLPLSLFPLARINFLKLKRIKIEIHLLYAMKIKNLIKYIKTHATSIISLNLCFYQLDGTHEFTFDYITQNISFYPQI